MFQGAVTTSKSFLPNAPIQRPHYDPNVLLILTPAGQSTEEMRSYASPPKQTQKKACLRTAFCGQDGPQAGYRHR